MLYKQTLNKEPNNEINAMKKGALLCEEKVRGMSDCKENNIHVYVGAVEAARKKRVVYNIKGAIHPSGEVIHSACECPAGAGPHATCKHLVAGMFF